MLRSTFNFMVSVIIPTKERSALLRAALESVRNQSFTGWECIVVDDHSTDATAHVVAQFHSSDPRFIYHDLDQTSSGANAARNYGLKAARGDLVVFLDSDDALAPHCLEQRITQMDREPQLDFAVWPTLLFDSEPGDSSLLRNVNTDENDLDRYLSLDIPWQTAGVMWRRSALDKVGWWNESLPSWQDWDFHIRALSLNLAYHKYDLPDSYWRKPWADSLWSQSKQDVHLRAQAALLDELLPRFLERGCLNEKRKRLLAGLYFWLSRAWHSARRNRLQAVKVWSRAYRKDLISFRRFAEGCKWFSRLTRGKSRSLAAAFPTWPRELLIEASPTFWNIPYRVPTTHGVDASCE